MYVINPLKLGIIRFKMNTERQYTLQRAKGHRATEFSQNASVLRRKRYSILRVRSITVPSTLHGKYTCFYILFTQYCITIFYIVTIDLVSCIDTLLCCILGEFFYKF